MTATATLSPPAGGGQGSIALVVGTRPESIKMAPIAAALGADAITIHTGQHDSPGMIQSWAQCRSRTLAPIRAGSRGNQLGRMIAGLDAVFTADQPAVVAVQGDTTSAVAGALAANAAAIPLLHVEAGLRSFDRRMPEEHNRILIDHLADLCCAPTALAVEHLRGEGIPSHRIAFTGNPVVEAATQALPTPAAQDMILRQTELIDRGYVLATLHRPENVDDDISLSEILHALTRASLPVLLPVHPRLRPRLDGHQALLRDSPIRLTGPLSYPHLLAIAHRARLVVTDSGGLQEEVTVVKTPTIVVRRSNERPEIEGLFGRRVIPPDLGSELKEQLTTTRPDLRWIPCPYGDGSAAIRIARHARQLKDSSAAQLTTAEDTL